MGGAVSGSEGKRRGGVSEDDVRAIAALARLKPRKGTIPQLTSELNRILEHVQALESLDLSGLEGEGTLSPGRAPVRDPGARPDDLAPDAVRGMAPDWREGFFVVPRLPALDGGRSPADESR